ncbi:MAG: shikimate dehydrogenase [Elusimicrobia bacterium]|nr:shikimate dehydrogenase [Elusimicrobiota bacterium]
MLNAPPRLALLGHPVAHSLSPRLMAALARLTGRRVLYRCCDVAPDKLAFAAGLLRGADFLGCNVTIPHKTAVIPFLDRLTPQARLAGAVNAVRRDGELLVGHNTDLAGFADALRDAGFSARGRDALVFGAGGAARAVAAALGRLGARRVTIWARRPAAARALARGFAALFQRTKFRAGAPRAADLAVNATPLGLPGWPDLSPAPPDWRGCACAFDLVYGRRTAFQAQALRLGARAVGGNGMLVCQALRGWEFWFGPLGAARRAALKERLVAHLASAGPRCD